MDILVVITPKTGLTGKICDGTISHIIIATISLYNKQFHCHRCIFRFIPLLLPVFLFKPLICNTVDFFIRHEYPAKHRTNNFLVILTLTC